MNKNINLVFQLLTIIVIHSCNNHIQLNNPQMVNTKVKGISNSMKNNNHDSGVSNKIFIKPASINDDGNVYLFADSNTYTFNFGLNRCGCEFPFINRNNKISLKWAINNLSCDYKNTLSETFGLKNYPKNGDVFAEIQVLGDTALRINYLYKEFFALQNQKGRENKEYKIDSIFPTIFQCSKCE